MVKKKTFVDILTGIHDSYVRSLQGKFNSFDKLLVENILKNLDELLTNKEKDDVFQFMKIHSYGYNECKEIGTNDTLEKVFSDFYDSLVGIPLFNFKVAVERNNPNNTVQYIYVKDLNDDKMTLQRFVETYFNFSMYNGSVALYGNTRKYHIYIVPNSYVVRHKDVDGSFDIEIFNTTDFENKYFCLDKENETKVWIARDKDGAVYLYRKKPWRNTSEKIWLDWDYGYIDWKDENSYLLCLDKNDYSNIEWNDEPVKISVGELKEDIKDKLRNLDL